MADRLRVQRSPSGLYWAVTLDGDNMHPLYQDSSKARCEQEKAELGKLIGEKHG